MEGVENMSSKENQTTVEKSKSTLGNQWVVYPLNTYEEHQRRGRGTGNGAPLLFLIVEGQISGSTAVITLSFCLNLT